MTAESPWRARAKTLTYRSRSGSSLAAHAAHWSGFSFEAGSCIVSWSGDWGEIQVWAKDRAEGLRVVSHACAAGGLPDPVASPGAGVLLVRAARGGRNGKPGTFKTATIDGFPVVTSRAGPSGAPWIG
jgi:hypothetical protein